VELYEIEQKSSFSIGTLTSLFYCDKMAMISNKRMGCALLPTIDNILKKHKNILILIVAISIFLVIFAAYFSIVSRVSKAPKDMISISEQVLDDASDNAMAVTIGEITDGTVVFQEFNIPSGEFAGIALQFGTYERTNNGTLDVNIKAGTEVFNKTIDVNDIEDKKYYNFAFDNAVTFADDTQAVITINNQNSEKSHAVTIYAYETEKSSSSCLSINGNPTNYSLDMQLYGSQTSPYVTIIYLLFMFIVIIGFVLAYIALVVKKIKMTTVFVIALAVFGVVYMFMFPPATVPDEPSHFYTAYRYSNFMTFNFEQRSANGVLMRQGDNIVIKSTEASLEQYNSEIKDFQWFCSDNTLTLVGGDNIKNAPFAYIISGLGIAFARLLHLGAYPMFYMGRFFNLLVFIAMAYYAMKKMPFGKIAIFAISMTPMVLHLAASYSYDAFIIGLAMVFVAKFLDAAYGHNTIGIKNIVIISLIAFVLAPSKLVYVTIIFVVLLIPKNKFINAKYHIAFKCSVILAGLIGLIFVQMASISTITATGEHLITWSGTPGYTISDIIKSPFHIAAVLYSTIIQKGDFYLGSLVGINLGWFQTSIEWYMGVGFLAIIAAAFIMKDDEPQPIKPSGKIWIACLIFASAFLIMISMLVSWTPLEYTYIEGVQGRYFIPLLPLVFILVRSKYITAKKDFDKGIILFSVFLNTLAIIKVYCDILSV